MKVILIIHFSPLEWYPPVQNLIHELGKALTEERIIIITTKNAQTRLATFQSGAPKIEILRPVIARQDDVSLRRFINYFTFYFVCLFELARYWPSAVLYFETISSFPVYLFKRLLNRGAEVFIHYHEYTSRAEYRSGMTLVKWFHKFERWLYPRAIWVSHTNHFRLERFKDDIAPVVIQNSYVLPNYPPKSWHRQPRRVTGSPMKIVYAGALSMHTMFTRNFAEWIQQQNGKVVWDIYTYNCTDEAREYLQALGSPFINLKPGVDYHDLPDHFEKYHVGVILYNGHIPNYVFNAPNKLFEYWACGLSVWFPDVMTGSLPYCTRNAYPAVIALNFNSLDNLKVEELMSDAVSLQEPAYFSEDALRELIRELIK